MVAWEVIGLLTYEAHDNKRVSEELKDEVKKS